MVDGPSKDLFKDFINKLPAKRNPLTEVERREALKVAESIHDVVATKTQIDAKKTGNKDFGNFAVETPNLKREMSIWLNKEIIESYEPENPQTDMIILVSDHIKDESGKASPFVSVSKLYYFAPDEVIVEAAIHSDGPSRMSIGVDPNTNKITAKYEDPEQAESVREEETREAYNPDKAELSQLLSDIVLAKQEPYMI